MTTTASLQEVCRWCGSLHGHLCPAVKALEYYPDGTVKRVEFVGPLPVSQPTPDGLRTTWTNSQWQHHEFMGGDATCNDDVA